MKRKGVFRFLSAAICMLCCVFLLPAAAYAEDGTAKELTRDSRFLKNGNDTPATYAHDGKLRTVCPLGEKDVLTVQPKNGDAIFGAAYACVDRQEAVLTVRAYDRKGTLLEVLTPETNAYRISVYLPDGCSRIEITGEAGEVGICELQVFGVGTLPDTLAEPLPSVERTDFLIVTTHPDDEWIFLGAVYPIYGAEQGYTGTFAYVTTPNIGRVHEAINSVWAAGMDTLPYFLGFPDVDRSAPQSLKDTFREEEVTLSLVRLYRKIKPLVVISQDPVHGEYGHWQHIISARSALEAAVLAEDAAYDPASAEEYGTWSVKKVYQHLAEENPITLDVNTPLSAYNGETALQVAKRAFSEHKSQLVYSFRPSVGNSSYGDIRYFGLTRTVVGTDTGNDMFEHIEQKDLAEVILNATPEPTEEPTPEPTEEPTAEPTRGPTPKPTAKPTPEPVVQTPAEAESEKKPLIGWICGAVAAALLLGTGIGLVLRRRKNTNTQ